MGSLVVGTRCTAIRALGALLGVAAWTGCIDTSGSRTDFVANGSSATGGDDGGPSSGSSSSSGSGGSSGSTSSGGSAPEAGSTMVMPATPDLCGFPPTMAMNPILYSGVPAGGGGANCPGSLPPPRNGSWFSYHDASGDGGLSLSAKATVGGCGGLSLCAYHIAGPPSGMGGFSVYGAGCGFDLNDNASGTATNYDVTPYKGIQYWAKGTITGTRGPGFAASAQTIHLKVVTATNRNGDDYGAYCQMIDPMIWTMCSADFSALTRDGFSTTPDPTTDSFDGTQAQKVQFELSLASPGSVSFDAWIDEVSFY